jgi:formiminotetrahydrofolate cyclodeaminase
MGIYDKTQTIESFLSVAAGKQPIPGGGSVAALAGALAASMGEMVVNYSIGRKDLVEHQDQLKQAMTELCRARHILLELMVEDQAAYEALSAARKRPATDPDRAGTFEAALLACIRVPQAVGATAAAVLGLCQRLVERVNKHLLSDLAVCAELSMATVRCAACSIRANLRDVADPDERRSLEQAVVRQIADCVLLVRDVMAGIGAREGQP